MTRIPSKKSKGTKCTYINVYICIYIYLYMYMYIYVKILRIYVNHSCIQAAYIFKYHIE
jgi:hypothetical protein